MSEPATDDHNAQVLFGQGDDEADHPGIARSSLVRSVITKLQTNGDLVYPRHRHWLLSWIYSSPFLQLAALKTQTVLCPQLEVHRDELITTDGGGVVFESSNSDFLHRLHDLTLHPIELFPSSCPRHHRAQSQRLLIVTH